MMSDNILNNYDEVLIPKDLESILHVGRSTVYRLLGEGTIKSIKIGNSYRIPKMSLVEFMYPNATTGKE